MKKAISNFNKSSPWQKRWQKRELLRLEHIEKERVNKNEKIKVRITFIEAVLGTWPSNQNIAREFIASKSPDASTIEDEVAALGADAVADKGMTVFPRNENGEPILYDYQIKGMFKDACGMLGRIGGKTETGKKKAVNESGKLTAYKKVIDGLILFSPV